MCQGEAQQLNASQCVMQQLIKMLRCCTRRVRAQLLAAGLTNTSRGSGSLCTVISNNAGTSSSSCCSLCLFTPPPLALPQQLIFNSATQTLQVCGKRRPLFFGDGGRGNACSRAPFGLGCIIKPNVGSNDVRTGPLTSAPSPSTVRTTQLHTPNAAQSNRF